MRRLFRSYYRPTPDEFQTLWSECVFIFDTNALLDLYRYPKKTRDELLELLQRIADRVWIPFQVALEYQENRLSVIAEQVKRYNEVQGILKEYQDKLSSDLNKLQLRKRHSSINPEPLIKNINKQIEGFLAEVQSLRQEQPDVQDEDKLREQIDLLFDQKIGPAPSSQADLDGIYEEGKARYSRLQPPGYMDRAKDKSDKQKDEQDFHTYKGMTFKKEYGDLILWKQIIKEMRDRQKKYAIFITNDEKEDWLWISDSNGKRTIGPRNELIDEIQTEAGVDLFYIYNTERFLLFARDYFKIPVSQESINQVRDITNVSQNRMSFETFSARTRHAEHAVYDWLLSMEKYQDIRRNDVGFPDLVVLTSDGQRRIGYDVRYQIDHRTSPLRLRDIMYRGYYEINEGNLDELNIVVVCDNLEMIERSRKVIGRFSLSHPKLNIVYGLLNSEEEGQEDFKATFTPV